MSIAKARDSARNAIRRYQKVSIEEGAQLRKEQITGYMELLRQQWSRFHDAQEQMEITSGDENQALEESERTQAENWYINTKANFLQLLAAKEQEENSEQELNASLNVVPQLKLPVFELPRFNGKPTTWMSFHDSFKAIVHDQNGLTGSQKLHYLRSCLSEEPLQLISNFKLQDGNYNEAWLLLKNRYHVQRVIIDNHFSAIFNVEKAKGDTAQAIKGVLDPILQNTRALNVMLLPTKHWDDWLVHIIAHKLDYETRRQWELSLNGDDRPTLNQLQEFLEARCRSLEVLNFENSKSSSNQKATKPKPTTANCNTSQKQQTTTGCLNCSGDHKIKSCTEFLRLTPQQRIDVVRRKNACFNCLSTMHHIKDCKSTSTCRTCSQRHHTLLHGRESTPQKEALVQQSEAEQNKVEALSSHHVNDDATAPQEQRSSTILLATALVSVCDSNKKRHIIRVLLDSGSHSSFVTESCVQRLGLKRRHKNVVITGIGCTRSNVKGEVTFEVESLNSKYTVSLSALILPKLTSYVPTEKVITKDWSHLKGLSLADPKFSSPGRIDLIMGAGELASILEPDIIRGPPGTPTAQKTALGWVLFGKITNDQPQCIATCLHADLELAKLIKQAWNLDEFTEKPFQTPEESLCEQQFDSTHERDADGRFIVTLPFKPNFELGQSREFAISSWLRMEKRLDKDEELRARYNSFMQEMVDQGHMQPVTARTEKSYYMPHHCVVKATSTTTKLRVVFNASHKTSNGRSLNDVLMVGPTLQQDLASILNRFQSHRYALTADVAAMYRQIKVCGSHTDYQRIIWRKSTNEPLQDFRLLRVTYGVASSAHHAVRSLQQTTRIDANTDSSAANAIRNDFYMDDLLTGADTEQSLDALCKNISQTLKLGCFELRKWATNSPRTLSNIPEEALGAQKDHLLADDENVRVLGLMWNSSTDELYFDVNLGQPPPSFTKRTLLSDSCRLFDPTGKLAPITLIPKTLFQRIWQLSIDWDDLIPEDLANYWLEHRSDLKALAKLRIPRWLGTGREGSITDLHCFADASEIAYAAVIYARTQCSDGSIVVRLVNSKTKVAPLRTITISRLELCASTLAAELAAQTERSLGLKIRKVYGWTDSLNALAWLRSHPSKWKIFVANRVSKAQAIIDAPFWNYVASECNPSDCASRGMCASKLLRFDLWWRGPSWLQQSEETWPIHNTKFTTEKELRPLRVLAHSSSSGKGWLQDILSSFSSFCRLKRVTAYCLRFWENCKRKKQKSELLLGMFKCFEMQRAQIIWFKAVQNDAFLEEIKSCSNGKPVSLRSSIARLNAFIDNKGLLRVGGRLKHSTLHHDSKFPIILPAKSQLCILILNDIHKLMLHAGPQLMQAALQRNYWIIGARNLIRNFYRKCVICLRHSTNAQQMMANLPQYRVTQARPFLNAGVDMAGPFMLKFSKGRGAKTTKGYIALFICMSTGAMHLELAGDLSTPTFIAVLKRFVSRRGYCKTLISDNGTNFVGAERELKSMFKQAQSDESLRRFVADRCMEWKFNPPYAPNMGGYWEIAVKRVKYHLKRALRQTLLTYEEFNTVLIEIEACVNSRPLCPLANDASDPEVLTPGHFLITEPLVTIPEPQDTTYQGSLLQRWQLIMQTRNHFWRRWHVEYLASLQKRAKWLRPKVNLREGDIVVVKDEKTPHAKWPLGKIINCLPGDDGIVRVAELKTSDGIIKRPTSKLIPILPQFSTP